ncbi:hypothetical protein TNCV_1517861 [Trichonephila clavipes]|nr:hypothetical protein TNCV_1517861 [Trichonephila clavipes]
MLPRDGFLYGSHSENGDGIYQNGNVDFHRAQTVQTWFNDSHGVFYHLKWPSNGSDISAIENLWDDLESCLYNRIE